MTANRDWVKPGAKVAVLSAGWGNRYTIAEYDEIDRVLKRDIVLKGGRRFYFRREYDRDAIEKGSAKSYRSIYLYPVNHIHVRDAETEQQESELRASVRKAFDKWDTRTPTVASADTLIAAVEAWKALQPQEAVS